MISSSSSFRNTKKSGCLFRELLSRFYCHLQLLKGVPFSSLNGTQLFEKSLDCLKRLRYSQLVSKVSLTIYEKVYQQNTIFKGFLARDVEVFSYFNSDSIRLRKANSSLLIIYL